ncbi:MAG TPA: GyrI-like domain-containing protein [Burkholderiaceae bacterium]|nr:GyrI-like domain-containing protein [Burkholderiaceae bacterium]
MSNAAAHAALPAGGGRQDHAQRMHAVLRHIDAHLDQPLTLGQLAAVANFSPYHFHRLFSAWMAGETLGGYISQRRVQLGAHRLLSQPGQPILQVALAVGFGSGEAFARAFKQRFGQSPTAWRRAFRANRNPDQVLRNLDQTAPALPEQNEPMPHAPSFDLDQVRLVERYHTRIAYLRHEGPLGLPVQQFWLTEVQPWLRRLGWPAQVQYGISHDDPVVSNPERCRYDAGVDVPSGTPLPPGTFTALLPGGRYAVMPFRGRADHIGLAWSALLRDWLPDSGWQLDYRPCFERYAVDCGFDPETGAFSCEICVPVAIA